MSVRRLASSPATPAERCRARRSGGPRQTDLFDGAPRAETPRWPELPTEARAALTNLMTQLILDHASKTATSPAREVGHDL